MRILVIHTSYKFKGGEDSVVANEVELLKSMGNTVELLIFSNIGGTFGKLAMLPFNYSSYAATKKKIQTFNPDVAHIHNLHFAGSHSVIYALKKKHIPIIITLHNYRLLCPTATLFHDGKIYTKSVKKEFNWDAVINGVYQNSKLVTFWVSFAMWFHQRLATWREPSAYIALGQFTKEIFANSKLSGISGRIFIKPNFCYLNSQVKPAHSERKMYLYVGRLSEEKGILVLLKAFQGNNLPLTIAGSGPFENEVIAAAQHNKNIEFIGMASKDKVNELLSNAKALIFPSLWYETFGMVIIEAFASGTPVIASDLGQLKFMVTDKYNGLHFETGNAESLQKKIFYLCTLNENDYTVYRKNALETYRNYYQPNENGRQLAEIYTNALTSLK